MLDTVRPTASSVSHDVILPVEITLYSNTLLASVDFLDRPPVVSGDFKVKIDDHRPMGLVSSSPAYCQVR